MLVARAVQHLCRILDFHGGIDMETPLIVTLARQMSVRDEMDVIANNIANMSTTAYQGERVMFRDYMARTESGTTVVFPQQAGIHRVTSPGPMERTSNSLDFAIRGDGYFEVETTNGQRFTRNGHFRLDGDGRLVTADGHPVMDDSQQPIVIETNVSEISVAKDGTVYADGNEVGKLRVVSFGNPRQLIREGGGLMKTDAEPDIPENFEILQGYVEGSNIEPILEITRFMRATGQYQQSKKIVDDEHDRQRRAIQTLGSMPE